MEIDGLRGVSSLSWAETLAAVSFRPRCCTVQADAHAALALTPQVVASECLSETSRRRYFEALRPYLAGRILDFGGGDGSLMSWAFEASILTEDGPRQVTLLDSNQQLVDRARQRLAAASVLCHGQGPWPFEAEAFDVVLLAFVLHHVPVSERQGLLREARRCGRRTVVLEDLPDNRLAWQVTEEHFRPFGQDPEDYLQGVWPLEQWRSVFEEAGYRIEAEQRIEGSLRYPVPHMLFNLEPR